MNKLKIELIKAENLFKRLKQLFGAGRIYSVAPSEGDELLQKYDSIANNLRNYLPGMYGDLPTHAKPEATEVVTPNYPLQYPTAPFRKLMSDVEDILSFKEQAESIFEANEHRHNSKAQSKPTSIGIFISHSHKDKDLAKSLADLLVYALSMRMEEVRCTSVPGYKLEAGIDTAETLRREVHETKVLIGLITPNSIHSSYVLFELGARWGHGGHSIPLLAAGAKSDALPGTLPDLNALKCEREDVIQLLRDVASRLGKELNNTEGYLSAVDSIVRKSKAVGKKLLIEAQGANKSDDKKSGNSRTKKGVSTEPTPLAEFRGFNLNVDLEGFGAEDIEQAVLATSGALSVPIDGYRVTEGLTSLYIWTKEDPDISRGFAVANQVAKWLKTDVEFRGLVTGKR